MKNGLLALCFIAALPGCGCLRKNSNKTKAPKKEMTDKDAAKKRTAKTHMDMHSAY